MASFHPINAESACALPPISSLIDRLDVQEPNHWATRPVEDQTLDVHCLTGSSNSADESWQAHEAKLKSAGKNHRAKQDRERLASQVQAQEDALRYFIGYEPSRPQTKGNGKISGLQGDKVEVMMMSTHLLCAFLSHFKKHAEQENFQEHLDAFYATSIASVKTHVESQRAMDAKRAILPPDNIMSAPDSDHQDCFGVMAKEVMVCGAHYSTTASTGLGDKVDWRSCRYARRKEIMDGKFSIGKDAADLDVSMGDHVLASNADGVTTRSRL